MGERNNVRNADLQAVYETIYQNGEASFFSRFSLGADDSENDTVILEATDWRDKTVLDIGCGTGHTAVVIARAGAKHVTGIDYAPTAIEQARELHQHPGLTFKEMGAADWTEPVDVILSCGTLEHMDDPATELRRMTTLVGAGGEIIVTCPYFINIRGFVWMTLAKLFEVPMSLTDRHFISPFDVSRWLEGSGFHLARTVTYDYDRANGRLMLQDMTKRLTNALRDANMPNHRVADLMNWLESVVAYQEQAGQPSMGGRNALYYITADQEA
jgi:2-polyprenyl-3-methyl-5-hydroxy-6-metoxy-1,4-benzoquinol methylase